MTPEIIDANTAENMTWIKTSDTLPELSGSGYEKTSDIVEVQFSNGRIGLGYIFDNYHRSGWRSKYTESFSYYDKGWGGISVIAWRPLKELSEVTL
jgi:hypothetical protein